MYVMYVNALNAKYMQLKNIKLTIISQSKISNKSRNKLKK